MFIDFLGKFLFPRHQPWKRRREVKNILFAVTVGLTLSSFVVMVGLLKNHFHSSP